jgi:hypothetical protein
MSNNKQSSIEWVEQQFQIIIEKNNIELEKIWQQLKAMRKDEIVDAYREGRSDQQSARNQSFYHRNAEQYYNEIFGGEK